MSEVFVSRTRSLEGYKERVALAESMAYSVLNLDGLNVPECRFYYFVPWKEYFAKISSDNFEISEVFSRFLKSRDMSKDEGFQIADKVFQKISGILNSFSIPERAINTEAYRVKRLLRSDREYKCYDFPTSESIFDYPKIKGGVGHYSIPCLYFEESRNDSSYFTPRITIRCYQNLLNVEEKPCFDLSRDSVVLYGSSFYYAIWGNCDCPFEYVLAELINIWRHDPSLEVVDEVFDVIRKEIHKDRNPFVKKGISICNIRFENLFHNTGKNLKEVLDIMVKEGFPKKDIVNSIVEVLGSVTWDD